MRVAWEDPMNTVPLIIATPRETIAALQRLTREYASFSRSRSGLGNVLGGVCSLLAFAADWALGTSSLAAAITVSLTLMWLVGKEIIRRRIYQGCPGRWPGPTCSSAWPHRGLSGVSSQPRTS